MTIAKHASSGQVPQDTTPRKREKGSGGAISPPEGSGALPGEASSLAEPLDPQIAVRFDGVILVEVKDVDARDLRDCEKATYIVLRGKQAAMAAAHIACSGADFASRWLGQLPMKQR